MKIKTGVVGYGFSGRIFQCPFIDAHKRFDLSAIVQRTGNESRNDYPNAKIYTDYSDLLFDQDIELVVIATPAHLHFEHAMKALAAKKHVLIEKPFATTREEALQLVKKAKEVKRIVTVYQNRRFDSDFLTMKKLIDDGVRIYEYEATWDRFVPNIDEDNWHEQGYKGSDLLFDLGTHFLDQAIALFGEPKNIFGTAKTLRPNSKIHDYFSIQLEYTDKIVRLKSCMHATHEDVKYKLHTSKGTYYFYKMDLQEEQLIAGLRPLDTKYGDSSNYDIFDLQGNKSSEQVIKGNYLMFFTVLAEAIRDGKKLPVSNEDAVRVITYLEQISEGKLK